MAIMYMGRIIERGPTRDMFSGPAHPYTHALLAAQPRPDPDRRREGVELQGEVPSLLTRPSGCEFHTRCPMVRDRFCPAMRPEPEFISSNDQHRCHFPLVNHGQEGVSGRIRRVRADAGRHLPSTASNAPEAMLYSLINYYAACGRPAPPKYNARDWRAIQKCHAQPPARGRTT